MDLGRAVWQSLKAAGWILLVLCFLLLLLPLLPYRSFTYFEAGWVLLTGWITVVGRNLAAMTVQWPAVAMAGVCWAGLWFGIGCLLRYRGNQGGAGAGRRGRPWRTSLALTSLVVVLFLVGTAVAGAWQHAAWLAESDRPFIVNRRSHLVFQNVPRHISLLVRIGLNDHNDQLEPAIEFAVREFAAEQRTKKDMLQHRLYLVSGSGSNDFEILHIAPGRPGQPPGYRIFDDETDVRQLLPNELPAWLEQHGGQFRQLWPVFPRSALEPAVNELPTSS